MTITNINISFGLELVSICGTKILIIYQVNKKTNLKMDQYYDISDQNVIYNTLNPS